MNYLKINYICNNKMLLIVKHNTNFNFTHKMINQLLKVNIFFKENLKNSNLKNLEEKMLII